MVGENITKKLKPRIGKKILYECGTNSYKRTIKFHQPAKSPGCFSKGGCSEDSFPFSKTTQGCCQMAKQEKISTGMPPPRGILQKMLGLEHIMGNHHVMHALGTSAPAICTSQGPAASPCSSCEPASPSPAKISFWQGAAQRSS